MKRARILTSTCCQDQNTNAESVAYSLPDCPFLRNTPKLSTEASRLTSAGFATRPLPLLADSNYMLSPTEPRGGILASSAAGGSNTRQISRNMSK